LAGITLVSADPGLHERLADFEEIVLDELNVKRLVWADRAEDFVSWEVKPNWRVLGKRLGPRMKATAAAIEAADAARLRSELLSRGVATVAVGEEQLELGAEELAVQLVPRSGVVAEADRDLLLVLDTEVDDALRLEGLAREVTNRIQVARREAGLEFTDRIELRLGADGDLARAIETHRDLIASETLARSLMVTPVAELEAPAVEVDDHSLRVALAVA
jgi:isoleucyl-tRNA synthetase